jgi:DNA polymerase III delta subunit
MRFDADKAAAHRAVYLGGEEAVHRHRALRALLERAVTDECDVETFGADERAPDEWTALAGTAPFLGSRRVVVVRNVGRADPASLWPGLTLGAEHPFAVSVSLLPETALLVLALDDETGDEDKRQRAAARGKIWSRLVSAGKGFVQEFSADTKALPVLLQEEAKALGKRMSPKASMKLAEMCGGQFSVAVGELEKLAMFVGDAQEVTERDVLAAVAPDPDYSVYVLVNSALRGDAGAALNQLRILIGRNPRPEETVFSRLFPAFMSTLRMAWQARFCLDKRVDPTDIPPDVARWLPEKTVADEPPWRLEQHVKTARRLSLGQLATCFEELLRAEASIKGLVPSANLTATLELMTLRIAATCRPQKR